MINDQPLGYEPLITWVPETMIIRDRDNGYTVMVDSVGIGTWYATHDDAEIALIAVNAAIQRMLKYQFQARDHAILTSA